MIERYAMKQRELKILSIAVISLLGISLVIQLHSLAVKKAFWLDEWFILYSIKFKSYPALFGNLFAIQQFPRFYLSIIKFFSERFDFSYLSLRIIPFIVQVINLLLVFFIVSKRIYGKQSLNRLLFIMLFLSFHTTLFYFSQVKPYTMDMCFSLMAVLIYDEIQKPERLQFTSGVYWSMVLCLFAGPFFSYTFPIMAAPLILILGFKFVKDSSEKRRWELILLIAVFSIAIVINYFTDLQFVLTDKIQYQSFSEYVMHYNSPVAVAKGMENIVWLFSSIFFFDSGLFARILPLLYTAKIFVILISLTGLVIVSRRSVFKFKYYQKRGDDWKNQRETDFDAYFILLFITTLVLYFGQKLPVGTHRINYFCFLFMSYFFLEGLHYVSAKVFKLKPVFLTAALFIAFFPTITANIFEIEGKNLNFDQRIYDNISSALEAAKADHTHTIIVKHNEFFPASIAPEQERLTILTHYEYDVRKPINIVTTDSPKVILARADTKFPCIIISKYTYRIFTRHKG
jgi:hypothetical protein